MLKRVLVANRGEIAVRVIRAAHDLGVEAVAVFSEADRGALHTRLADRAVCIGPAPAARSYLDRGALVTAALGTGCDALHPGYGFLAEDAALSRLCAENGVKFVGPGPDAIALMGDKQAARTAMVEAGVPVVPGSEGVLAGPEQASAATAAIGFPVLLKARAGGGGRGMRVVTEPGALAPSLQAASAEAHAAFGDGGIYLERYLPRVRHVEVQVLADGQGRVVHLNERDCTVQRRHQKLIEEAPSPAVTPGMRERLGEVALRACRAVGYESAGTLEFLLDLDTRDFYFIEMNTRIQVEHPVTEMVTGQDLVAWQLRIAGGEPLTLAQDAVAPLGHAIECRVNAEDPERGFLPVPGRLDRFEPPGGPGVRVDTHCRTGAVIPPFYDSLIAKLIVHGESRAQAIARMLRALSEFEVAGVPTTIPLHRRLLGHPGFATPDFGTAFVESVLDGAGEPARS